MKKIMEFSGNKSVEIVEKQDYAYAAIILPKEYREVAIITQDDFNRAVQANCRIYMRTFEFSGEKVKRFFIRVPKEELFKVAEKC